MIWRDSKAAILLLRYLFVVTVSLLGHSYSFAKNESVKTVYGPEWTFTQVERTLRDEIPSIISQVMQTAEQLYPGRVVLQGESGVYPEIVIDGKLKLALTHDPGVIEVQSTPLSVADWKKYKDITQTLVFDVMAQNNFIPHEREGAGHINIGTKSLSEHKNLVTHFILDFLSHPGVGISLNSETANQEDAQNLYDHTAEKVNISERGSGLTQKLIEQPGYVTLMKSLITGAQTVDEQVPVAANTDIGRFIRYLEQKFVAIGLRDTQRNNQQGQKIIVLKDERSRMEVRQIRPQQNMDQFIKLIVLFEARLNYLKKNGYDQAAFDQRILYDGWEVLGQFADYIEEAGLKRTDYIEFLPKMWQNLEPKNFIRKNPKKSRGSLRCESLF